MEFPAEVDAIKESGAQGIGLFRTEFFYIDRGGVPSEEEQFEVYREVIERMAPQPVTCRTLDLGGDKLISEMGAPGGKNPFLGMRSIRLCLANPDIFKIQLRALMRASAYGNARIMFPLVTDISEVRQAKALLREVQEELAQQGIDFDKDLKVGVMIETPAAALTAGDLAREVDFFSIGTNDLIQYTLAVDRATESVAALYNPLHPSVIHLIRRTIDAAHQAGITVSVCGEVASDPGLAALLTALGVDELSMTPGAIPEVKRLIRSLNLDDMRNLRSDILSHLSSGQARSILDRFLRAHGIKRDKRVS
jgi:phosphotransferase system enzyme I (PtsI)